MTDEEMEKFGEEVLKPFFRMKRYYDAEELYEVITEKRINFEESLDEKQTEDFSEMWKLILRYIELSNEDYLSRGFFQGCNYDKIK